MRKVGEFRPPTRELVRAVFPGACSLRAQSGGGDTLMGHFAVFDQWTEIDSWFEGRFLEKLAPGAFRKTFSENRDSMRILLQHGRDPQLGAKPIAGPIRELREDDKGAYYEAPLFAGLPALVVDGLRAGQYGASFRFEVMREERNEKPGVSAYNPEGIPERTVLEAKVAEFGPVTFPAYASATAGVRSLTDEFALMDLRDRNPDRLRDLLQYITKRGSRNERAAELDSATIAAIAQIDSLIDEVDEVVDTLMDDLGIPDPDEAAEGEAEEKSAAAGGTERTASTEARTLRARRRRVIATPRVGAPRSDSAMNDEEWRRWIRE